MADNGHRKIADGSADHDVDGELVALLTAHPDMLFEFDAEGTYIAYHSEPNELLAAEVEEMLGRNVREVLPADAAEAVLTAIACVKETGYVQTTVYTLPLNEALHHFEARVAPLGAERYLVIVRDITESERMVARLRASEERHRALVANVPGVIYRSANDAEWTMRFASERIFELTGYTAEEFVSGQCTLGQLIHPEDRARVDRMVQEALGRGEAFSLEYRILHADGSQRWVSERGQGAYDEDGRFVGLDGVLLDVTEQRQLRQQLVTNAQMASVGVLAAGMAHEINNPLAIVLANLDYIAEEITDVSAVLAGDAHVSAALSDVRSAMTKVEEGLLRVQRIVRDLRTFSDAAEQQMERVDVLRVLEWALQSVPQVEECATVVRDYEKVPYLWANEAGLVQVFANLLENACEAMPADGTQENQIGLRVYARPDRHIVVEVRDNGKGMRPEVAERIFDPFFTTRPVGMGTGLGLFVCQGIVRGLGGHIDVESAPGDGATFEVVLPIGQE